MTDGVLLQDQQRTPDGTRPLIVGRPVDFLEPALLEDPLSRLCFYVDSPGCRQHIQPGEHYLLHHDRDGADVRTGRTWSYCAPCAIREGHWWDVREATP